MSAPLSPIAISWVLSTISGYGIYGLQIILQYLRRGGQQVILPRQPTVTEVPSLTAQKLAPIFQLSQKLHAYLKERPDELLSFNHAVLHGVSSDFSGFAGQDRIWGKPNVGCAAIEHLVCTPHGREIAKNYDMFIAISRWNADYLKSLDVGPVYLRYQGIDPALFHPLPKSDLYKDRFVIFSGGKFEYRKGQDIVVAAFKRFREKHPEALLVACWQNLLPADAAAFAAAGLVEGVPQPAQSYGLQITPWLLQQGLPQDSFIDLPFTHNLLMPLVLRECDIALFPNRCEGGTNLVAMEAAACGIPTYVAANTGQKDLVELIGFPAFRHQGGVKASSVMNTVQDWGETDVDEVVQAMEYVYTQRQAARDEALQLAGRLTAWDWGSLNEKLLQIVCDGQGEAW
ncbi:MAG: glycosyltransferase family 4 protein [Alphaproteobacteria bacterium]|nr:glycosyltransferase family 4 protein [Alphaproteobacteria bacterium]MBV8548454.1 glycosyltransferase family 4 protein [Alphaproteobacteria bacterium]